MPWKVSDRMTLRQQFVEQASRKGIVFSKLCERFGISRKTGYKWLRRHDPDVSDSLRDRPRKPLLSPNLTPLLVEEAIVRLRSAHPFWGSQKIRKLLLNEARENGAAGLVPPLPPAASTITSVLRRRNLIDPVESEKRRHFTRFAREHPNDLWQMDFKGHFALQNHRRCHPLTITDDHSRYNICLKACPNERASTVKSALIEAFQIHGMPWDILTDNGSPWGNGSGLPYSQFSVWLMLLGVKVIHGKPCHPQTQGKAERFHRTLLLEAIRNRPIQDCVDAQAVFDPWRQLYNCIRPHASHAYETPASRYVKSPRIYTGQPLNFSYPNGDEIRKVDRKGEFSFSGYRYFLSDAFNGCSISLRHTRFEQLYEVFFINSCIAMLDDESHELVNCVE